MNKLATLTSLFENLTFSFLSVHSLKVLNASYQAYHQYFLSKIDLMGPHSFYRCWKPCKCCGSTCLNWRRFKNSAETFANATLLASEVNYTVRTCYAWRARVTTPMQTKADMKAMVATAVWAVTVTTSTQWQLPIVETELTGEPFQSSEFTK